MYKWYFFLTVGLLGAFPVHGMDKPSKALAESPAEKHIGSFYSFVTGEMLSVDGMLKLYGRGVRKKLKRSLSPKKLRGLKRKQPEIYTKLNGLVGALYGDKSVHDSAEGDFVLFCVASTYVRLLKATGKFPSEKEVTPTFSQACFLMMKARKGLPESDCRHELKPFSKEEMALMKRASVGDAGKA